MSDSTVERILPIPPTEATRVLFLTGRLDPTAACRAIVGLAEQLRGLGYEAELVSRGGSVRHVYRGAPGAASLPVSISRALSPNLRGLLSLRTLVEHVRQADPALLHVHGARRAGVAARLARRVRKPYVLSIGDFLDPGESIPMSRRFIKKVLVGSDALRIDLVNRIRIPRALIEVVPDGVDMARYPEPGSNGQWAGVAGAGRPASGQEPGAKSQEPGTAAGRVPVVGTVGRLAEAQGQEYFVRAAHLLAVRGRNVHFVIGGEGPDRKRLQNLVHELDLVGRFTFARAPVDQLDMLKAIDVMVVPALRESLGLPVIEAMACGIPVVATSAGAIFTLVENAKTGILVPKKDPDAIANQVERLLDRPETAARLAACGRERVAEKFRIESTARRTAEIYASILAREPGL